jgi:hypothetical protein
MEELFAKKPHLSSPVGEGNGEDVSEDLRGVSHSLKSGSPGKEKRRLNFKKDGEQLVQNIIKVQ